MFLVQWCLSKGQSSGTAGVPDGPSLWAGLHLQAAPLKSMPTLQLATEVPLLSHEDATHFTGFVSRIPSTSGCESQPSCFVHLPSALYSNVHTHWWTFPPSPPMLNILLLGHLLTYPATAFFLGAVFLVLENHHSKLYHAQLYWDNRWQQQCWKA